MSVTIIPPEHLHYDYLENYFFDCIQNGKSFLFDRTEFDMELRKHSEKLNVPYELLVSLVRNLNVRHVKRTAGKVKGRLSSYLVDYQTGRACILELAQRAKYPPYLFARFMVEAIAAIPKKNITDAMRDPSTVLAGKQAIAPEFHAAEEMRREEWKSNGKESRPFGTRLAYEVDQAIRADPMNGPMFDKDRHFVGVEYEVVLEYQLEQLGIPFESEEDLRNKGTSRTPDVLLSYPIGIPIWNQVTNQEEWKTICWIDSKALFGDVYTHNTTVMPQVESYVHRFGPGLVLYWFGHAPSERLENASGDITITAWELPTKIMRPTGEIVTTIK